MKTSIKLAGLALLLVILLIGTQIAYASNWDQIPVSLRQKIATLSDDKFTVELISPNISGNPAIEGHHFGPLNSYGSKNNLIVCGDILCKDGDHRIYITPWVYEGQLINQARP